MVKTLCEKVIWTVLPVIRKEFSLILMKNYDLNQKKIAEILDITPAAVCQYLSNKRGHIELQDKEILDEIEKSTRKIFEEGTKQVPIEICRICRLLHSKKIFKELEHFLRC